MRPLMLIAILALAGCAQPAQPPGAALAQETTGKIAGPAQSCITTFPAQNIRVIDPSTVAYGNGPTIYINHLGAPCPALSQFNTIIVDARDGNQYCRGNRIRGLETGGIIPGPWCTLGDWIPYRAP